MTEVWASSHVAIRPPPYIHAYAEDITEIYRERMDVNIDKRNILNRCLMYERIDIINSKERAANRRQRYLYGGCRNT